MNPSLFKLRNFLATLLCIFLISLSVLAQNSTARDEKCTLNLDQAPAIRGLHLGMTFDQVSKLFPEVLTEHPSFIIPDKDGLMTTYFTSPYSEKNRQVLKGVNMVFLYFLNKVLYQFSIQYDSANEWKDVDQFTRQISEKLHLPKAWLTARPISFMNCNGFQIRVEAGNGITEILLEDSSKQQEVEKINDKRRRDFKP